MKLRIFLLAILILLANFIIIFHIPQNVTSELDSKPMARNGVLSFGGGVSNGLPSSGYYDCIAVGNINGDSYMDFVCGGDDFDGSSSTQGLYYFSGNGAGTWTQMTITPTSSWAGIDIGDCDGDSNLEVYAGNQEGGGSGVGAWEWNGTGFSTSGITSPYTNGGVNFVNVKNISGGPGLDIVIAAHSGVKYYEGSGSSPISWTQYSTGLATNGQFTQSAIGDFNNDGLIDIVAGNYGNGLKFYTQNSGSTAWTDRTSTLPSVEQSGRIMGVAAGDVNKDGNMDVVYCRMTSPNGLFLLLGNGGGSNGTDFQWTYLNNSWASRPTRRFYQMNLGDVDKDGDLDLLAPRENANPNQYFGALNLYLGNGSDTPGLNFTWTDVTNTGLPINTNKSFYGSNFIDIDNDGDLDIAGCTWRDGIMVFQNNVTLPDVPVARAGSNQLVVLGNTVNLDGTDSSDAQDCPNGDSAGTSLTYDWNFTNQPSGSTLTDLNLTPSDSNAKPSFIPTHDGQYTLSLRVQDSENHWCLGEDFIRITVILVNTRPVANAGLDQEVITGALVTLDGSGSNDIEDSFNNLVIDWNVSGSNPSIVILNDETAVSPTFTAPSVTGFYQFTLVVQDSLGAWSLEDVVNVTVKLPPNIRPVANAGSDFSAYSNTSIILNGSASYDTDGSIISWDWNCTSYPSISISNENSSTPSFTPTIPGTYIFTLTIKDDRGSWAIEDSVIITVIEPNKRPIVNAGVDFTTWVNNITYLNGSASYDPDGSIITWNWTCTSNSSVILTNKNSSTPSFTPEQETTYVFTLSVNDNLGLWSGVDMVNITAQNRPIELNKKPLADSGTNKTVKVNTTVNLNGSKSIDVDGEIITWEWNCTNYPALEFMNENSSNPSFYAPLPGKYEITLRVQDDTGAWSDEHIVFITVLTPMQNQTNQTNQTKNSLPKIELTYPSGGETLSNITQITWTASDDDRDRLTFTILLLDSDGNTKATIKANIGSSIRKWDWNTKSVEDGTYKISISVNDGTDIREVTSGSFEIKNTIQTKPDDDKEEPKSEVRSNQFVEFFMALIIIIIIVIVVLFFVISRKKKHEKPPGAYYEPRYTTPQEVQPSEPDYVYEGALASETEPEYEAEHEYKLESDQEGGLDQEPDQNLETEIEEEPEQPELSEPESVEDLLIDQPEEELMDYPDEQLPEQEPEFTIEEEPFEDIEDPEQPLDDNEPYQDSTEDIDISENTEGKNITEDEED